MLAEFPLTYPVVPHALRLGAGRAPAVAESLERYGWRAEDCYCAPGLYLVEVRDPSVRGHPMVTVLRTEADVATFRRRYPDPRPPCRVRPRRTPGGWWASPSVLGTPAVPAAAYAGATWADVRAQRRRMGVGVRALARRLGLPCSTVAGWDTGRAGGAAAAAGAREAMAALTAMGGAP